MPELVNLIPMETHMWVVFALIIGAIISYSSDKIPMEMTSIGLISILLLYFFFFESINPDSYEKLTIDEILKGFANPALIGVISLLVIGQAIVQTNALNIIASLIKKISGGHAYIAMFISLLFVLLISGFLNNTPVVVIFIPILAALAHDMNFSASKVMIPLSFASILGGMTTLIGSSTNLLVSGIYDDLGYASLRFFDFALPGFILAGIGFIYVYLILPWFLKDRASKVKQYEDDTKREYVIQFDVNNKSELVGKSIAASLEGFEGLSARMLQRGEHAYLPPFDDELEIRQDDVLILAASRDSLNDFFKAFPETIEKHLASISDIDENDAEYNRDMTLAEIIIAPNSSVLGKTLAQLSFRQKHNLVVMGIQRGSKVIRTRITDIRLAAGDTLLVMGNRRDIAKLGERKDFVLMDWTTEDLHASGKALTTLSIFAGVVGLSAFGIAPITITSVAGVALMLAFKCLSIGQAGRAIDMNIILMIAASIALGTALQFTGGAQFIAEIIVNWIDGHSPIIALSGLFLFMMIITNLLSNNAAAVLFTPIAINLATALKVSTEPFIFAVIFACNCSFITPIGYQTNLMVMGPGHYKFRDFVTAGIPLAIIIWIAYTAIAYCIYF